MKNIYIYTDYHQLTMDAKDRLSAFFTTTPSVRVIASFADINSKRTTPNAYTSLLFVARPSLKYLQNVIHMKLAFDRNYSRLSSLTISIFTYSGAR